MRADLSIIRRCFEGVERRGRNTDIWSCSIIVLCRKEYISGLYHFNVLNEREDQVLFFWLQIHGTVEAYLSESKLDDK